MHKENKKKRDNIQKQKRKENNLLTGSQQKTSEHITRKWSTDSSHYASCFPQMD